MKNRKSNPNNPILEEYIKIFTCKNQEKGIGVLCKIPLKNCSFLPVFILHSKLLKKVDYPIILKSKNKSNIEITIDNPKNIYNDEESNISIIEIKKDNILENNNFLEIDDNPEERNDKTFCIAQYNINNDLIESSIRLKGLNSNNSFEYLLDSSDIQFGCPILDNKNSEYKFLGMHVEEKSESKNYKSVIINNCIQKYLNMHHYNKHNKIKEIDIIKDSIIINEIIIKYKIEDEETIKIFGEEFVFKNKNFCKIIIEGKEKKLCSEIDKNSIKINKENTFEIKLKNINDIINYNSMFAWCSTLVSFSNLSFDTSKATSMKNMFLGCELLESLPQDISEWDLGNVKDISGMFGSCSSLKYFPNISEWKTDKITDLSSLFSGCSSLVSLPDISKWKTSKVTNMNNLFSKCSSLKSLPDISKWDVKNVSNMNNLFSECSSLENLPNISSWNTQNVFNITRMFYKCQSLTSLPDISKWNVSKLEHINSLFEGCSSLKELPDISKWNTYNIKSLFSVFCGCSSLLSLPDISKWNTTRVTDMNSLFCGCSSLKQIPNISKWNTNNVNDMGSMFEGCSLLESLPDISKWNIKNVSYLNGMFEGCKENLNIPKEFKDRL